MKTCATDVRERVRAYEKGDGSMTSSRSTAARR